jgi:predicted MPP superfamily phosphohydrolase
MRNSTGWWILLALIILLDIYFYQSLRVVTQNASPRTRSIVHTGYWVISIGVVVLLILMPYLHLERYSRFLRTTLFAIVSGWFFAKFFASLFFLIDDIRRLALWIGANWFDKGNSLPSAAAGEGISRSVFLSWMGMVAGSGLFGTLIYGFGNKYRYQVRRVKLASPKIPAAFRGLKFVHISDIHSGSFTRKDGVMKGINKILKEKPDMILFTGDLVNNAADEMDDYMDVFSQLRAPMGVYSILGNHDYGDYVHWPSREARDQNLDKLKRIHSELGWKLLMNEHVSFERNGEKIALIGVENWSAKARFPKYGDLKKAHAGTESHSFRILMSHDPSHWKTEVLDAYPDIDLMLAGHTHGMQLGVEIPGFKWSPVQYMYKEWAGLYEKNGQKLYVNRGYGFLGYPGRVGILPEITVFELA